MNSKASNLASVLLQSATNAASHALTQPLVLPKAVLCPLIWLSYSSLLCPGPRTPSAWNTGLPPCPVSQSHLLTAAPANRAVLSRMTPQRPSGCPATGPRYVLTRSDLSVSLLLLTGQAPGWGGAGGGQGPCPAWSLAVRPVFTTDQLRRKELGIPWGRDQLREGEGFLHLRYRTEG